MNNTPSSRATFAPRGGATRGAAHVDAPHALADWYMATFIPDPAQYALMNPPGHEEKYIRRNTPLTRDMIIGALNGETRRTRPLPVGGGEQSKWSSVPNSFAITPQTKAARPLAKEIALDIDSGGVDAIGKILDVCKRHGLWAFVQLSKSATHDGGHVRIPCAELLSASMLANVGQRIAQAAGVGCEVWPADVDLRLPLQIHLRAPGGPRRFSLLLPSGELIDAGDPWQALDSLRTHFQPNATTCITKALETLPALPEPEKQTRPRHTSKVNGGNVSSVISWFNENFPMQNMLDDAGAEFKRDHQHFVCCPFHDDQSPSLAIWRHRDNDKFVCHCYSRNSQCPAAAGAYLDSFDVYKLRHNLSASEAVKKLATLHNLGKKRETVIEVAPVQPLRSTLAHNQQIAQARQQLAGELQKASELSGQVTVFNVTPGLGKTHQAAQLANRTYEQGLKVAIFAPTKEIANGEWMPRLTNGYVWQSKIDICQCHDTTLLARCIALGYAVPQCTDPACPYARQAQASYGKQIVYQHNHLHIRDGEKIEAQLLIIDESPMDALLPNRYVYPKTIKGFITRHPDDPAVPLLTAALSAMQELPQTINDVRGDMLVDVIEKHLNAPNGHPTLADAIKQTKRSIFYVAMPAAPDSIEKMAPQFLYSLLAVLEDGPDRLSFGRCESGEWGLVWHERKTLALSVYNCLYKPAIIILDGSANKTIYKPLCEPWPLQMVTIDCPVSPFVEIVQVNCTPSTRHVIREEERKAWLARQVAQVANKLGVVIDGGVTFKGATEVMDNLIGGQWLHYGGQRGNNELADVRTIAVVCSPTTPPYAIVRKALALWPDLAVEWKATGLVGAYEATDERLQAINCLHTLEELRQSIYRARPLTATAPTKLLVFTPWDLKSIGLTPDQTFTAIEHGNSTQAKSALAEYTQRREASRGLQQNADFQNGIVYSEGTPRIENDDFVAAIPSDSHLADETLPPQSAKEEPARRPIYTPMVGDVLTRYGKKIFVKRLNAEKVWFDVVDLGQNEGTHWLPVASFADQVIQMNPKIERVSASRRR